MPVPPRRRPRGPAQSQSQSQSQASTHQTTTTTTPDGIPTATPASTTSQTAAVPHPPKTNRVRWHGNADLAPSRVHAAAVAAAAAAAAAATTSSSSTSSGPSSQPMSASTSNPLTGSGATPTANTTAAAAIARGINPASARTTPDPTSHATSPNRVIRANHPGPLMLKQRLSDTGVPGVGYSVAGQGPLDSTGVAPPGAGIVANATAYPTIDETFSGPHHGSDVPPHRHDDDHDDHGDEEDDDDAGRGRALTTDSAAIPNPARAAAAAVKPSILSARLPLMQSPLPQNLNYAARELDERGMDEAAFQQLKAQLQLEAGRGKETSGGGVPQRTVAGGGRAGPARRPQSAVSSGGASGATSGASTPYSTDSSYDPAADSDLDHIDLIDGEVDGMPARLTKRQKQRIREQEEEERELAAENSGWAKLRKFIKVGGLRKGDDAEAEEGHSAAAAATSSDFAGAGKEKSQLHKYHFEGSGAGGPDDIGPTNLKSVPVTTSSGTHGGESNGLKRKPNKYERQAARLVRAHKLVSGSAGGAAGPIPSLPTTGGLDAFMFRAGEGEHRHHHPHRNHHRHHHHHHHHGSDDDDEYADDADHSRASSPDLSLDPRPVATGGVLGNLLRLYEPQQAATGAQTSATSHNPSLTSLLETPASVLHAHDVAHPARAPLATAPAPTRAPAGASRLRMSHLASDSPATGSIKSPPAAAGQTRNGRTADVDDAHDDEVPNNVEDMSPEALARRALEKKRRARVLEIEERLRRTLAPRHYHHHTADSSTSGGGGRQHRRGRSGASSLAGMMSSEYKRSSGGGAAARTPRRSLDGMSLASTATTSGAATGGGVASGGGRRQMMHSISASAFPISAAVIERTQHGGRELRKAATHVARVAASESGLESAMDERPKAARSAGGTIGALIATTGNLVGAVSPHLAQLGPNPRRPGYTLDRYLLPEMNAKTLRQTAEIIADAAPRRSVPGTPNVWASRSAPGSPRRLSVASGTPAFGGPTPPISGSRSQSGSRARNTLTSASAVALGEHSLHHHGEARSAPTSPRVVSAEGTGTHTAGSASPRGSVTVTAGSGSPSREKEKEKAMHDVHAQQAPASEHHHHPHLMSRAWSSAAAGLRSMPPTPGGGLRSRSSYALTHLPGMQSAGNRLHRAWTGLHSGINTPEEGGLGGDYFSPRGTTSGGGGTSVGAEDVEKMEWQRKLKRRQKKRKKEEIFITMHVAAILQRQEFLLKLARALMMFGAPTHKIESQIQHTARVLEISCRVIYLPNLMLLSFGDETTRTSEIKFIKQTAGLDLTKLTDMHDVYWNVVRDKISVTEASEQLDELMRRKPLIPRIPTILIGGFCSAFICVGPMGFNGSFIDALAAFPLGMFLVFCQGIITTELYSNVFEIVFCVLNSFIAAALHSTGIFCYSAVVSGSIVLILPGFIVLSGALELQSKNLIAGSVRLVYAIIYSLFLGMGLSIGVDFWTLVRNKPLDNASYCDARHHDPSIWYRRDVNLVWAFLTVPGYSMVLSLRNQAKMTRKEYPAMVLFACAGWACNHFASTARTLTGRQDITSALGSFAVGLLANFYGLFAGGRAFVVAVTGILYQLPSGLSNGGLLNFVDTTANTDATSGSGGISTSAFSNSGFSVAASLIEVALGLTVGLFASTIVGHYLMTKRQRGTMVFSF
ncbi:pheromone-regulated protein prm10 [Tilletia horrida]|uniref:Pheromone-regulated protein prm10 n=1 Tax=Tilletia horrida TaxID=155126 RepID=A0AAN6GGL4_9BASI|nr:pheromone-regulated protein prm10 [Tilletia horrida]